MSIKPQDLWAHLPEACREQVVRDLVTFFTELAHDHHDHLRTGPPHPPGASGGDLRPPGRAPGARAERPGLGTVTITRNEVLYALNQADKFLLALVLVGEDDAVDGPYYLRNPFDAEPGGHLVDHALGGVDGRAHAHAPVGPDRAAMRRDAPSGETVGRERVGPEQRLGAGGRVQGGREVGDPGGAHVGRDPGLDGQEGAVGGHRRPGDGRFFEPTVLVDVDHSMQIMREETFGPTLPIMKVADTEEALTLANDSDYGLQASVWTGDVERGEQLARRIQAGVVCVNDAQVNYTALNLPMGGWKASGLGTRHGASGIRKYTRTQSLLVTRRALKREPFMFPYTSSRTLLLRRMLRLFYGRGER